MGYSEGLLGEARTCPATRVRLVSGDGHCGQMAIEVTEDRFFIGRGSCCQIQLFSPIVSRVHALIQTREGRTFVRDLETRNGTAINGRMFRSREVEVVSGDRLLIGPCVFIFEIEKAREGAPSRAEAPAALASPEGTEGLAESAPPLCPVAGDALSAGACGLCRCPE